MNEQQCVGDFCPVLSNLQRPGFVVGSLEGIKVAPCSPDFFNSLERIGIAAEASGKRLQRMLAT